MTTYPTTSKQWLAKLVAFDTTCTKSNLDLIHYVRDYFASVGVQAELVYSPAKDKANLWATIPGERGLRTGGIVLSGHTDVVSVEGQKWDSDPWVLTERDGKLYGRGAADMKGFLAVTLALTPTFLKLNRAKPIHFAFSYDEEVGCAGVPYLIDYLKEKKFTADACLIGEPTGMNVETGCKGFCEWHVKVTGKAIHSSMALMNTSCNAIEYAAMIIAKIREIAVELRENGPRDNEYDCAFSPISTGLIQGGNAVNTVPAECTFTFSVRLIDKSTANWIEGKVQDYISATILPAMRKECAEASVEMPRGVQYPPFTGKESFPIVKFAREYLKDTKVRKSAGGNEAGFFAGELGIPSVVIGPDGADIHMPNEYVTVASMATCEAFTLDTVKLYTDPTLCRKGSL